MSTPQTLTQALPPHQYLDHGQRYLPSPQNRYLPPPRPSSNLSTSFHGQIPTRPPSGVSSQQFQPPPRPHSGMSGGHAHHGHSQSRTAAEYAYNNAGYTQHLANEDFRRTASRGSQHSRQLPPPEPSRAPAASTSQMAPGSRGAYLDSSQESPRKDKGKVDWVSYFGGKPPAEIITIHDDDSPGPTASIQRLPPPTTNGGGTAQHVDKRRRTNGAANTNGHYSSTNTPYSYTNGNGASTDSLQATTAPTSIGSQYSSSSRLDSSAQIGQKRKRPSTRTDSSSKKQETEHRGPKGYLTEYGDYVPPPKGMRKLRDVVVPAISDRHKTHEKVDDEDGHFVVHENSRLGERYTLLNLLGQGTFGKVVRALDVRSRKEVAVKIIRAVPKVRAACPLLPLAIFRLLTGSFSTVTPLGLSSACSRPSALLTRPTVTAASSSATASTGAAISASSRRSLA